MMEEVVPADLAPVDRNEGAGSLALADADADMLLEVAAGRPEEVAGEGAGCLVVVLY